MKSHTEYLWFKTDEKRGYIDITRDINKILGNSDISDGFILVSAMHTTSGVYVNNIDEGMTNDIDEWLENLAPFDLNYRHHIDGDINGDAHLKSLLVHHEVVIPVTHGQLDMGASQQIIYAEFDGMRKKRVVVKILGE